MKTSPCLDCQYRKATCHDYCKDYLEWHDEKVMQDKARAFDNLMGLIADQIIFRNRYERRRK